MRLTTLSYGPLVADTYESYPEQRQLFLASTEALRYGAERRPATIYRGYAPSTTPVSERPKREPQTVEDVIARGFFAVPRSDPSTAIISDKRTTSWLGLDDVIGQIRRRYVIYEKNDYEIELAKCSAINSLFTLIADQGSAPADSRETYRLNKRLQELYQQQRDERVRLWQDVSRLRLSLPESAQQYLAAYRTLSLLGDRGGGA